MLSLHSFRYNYDATLTITFAIADTNYNILVLPFLETYRKTIDTEHSRLTLKYNIHRIPALKQVPFLHISQKETLFYSKAFNLTVRNHIIVPGRHIRVIENPSTKLPNIPPKQA